MCCCNKENHNHSHDHSHNPTESIDDPTLSHDEKTLRVLLVHWINHNKSHQDNFLEWVEKSKKMEKPEVADYIKKAVDFMDKANEMLIEAKKHM
ncbi:zinc transporter [Natronincola ferrireducens]|uniref:DUF8180 domain-containing protein n=1 Tax=Natronincola ferrireducens TaxID=393762 RepID=A0A1G9ELU2_9FIRM|nr:zinc transporter [Natronincola ferrireducens]SDK76985.1 hypothetical protein SAMN05660472_02016 [Natronincola ferrireducens]